MSPTQRSVERPDVTRLAALTIVLGFLLVSGMPLFSDSWAQSLTRGTPENVLLSPHASSMGSFAPLPFPFPFLSPGLPPAYLGGTPSAPSVPFSNCLGSVQKTLEVSNNTTFPGNFQGLQVYYPIGLAYAPPQNDLLVQGYYSHNLGFFNVTTGQEEAIVTPPAPWYSTDVVYDPTNGFAYSTDLDPTGGAGHVSVIDVATRALVTEVAVGVFPRGAILDPVNHDLYVPNEDSNDVSVLSTTTNTVVATLGVGTYPMSAAYDGTNEYLYVANQGGNVTVLNTVTGKPVTSISLTSLGIPIFDLYDATDNDLYVGVASASANVYTPGTVAVINATTYATVTTVAVGDLPSWITLDPLTKQAFVSNSYSNTTSVIATATNTVATTLATGITPTGGTFVSASGHIYLADTSSNVLTVLAGGAPPSVVGSQHITTLLDGVAYDGATHDAYSASFDLSTTEVSTLYRVNGTSLGITGRVPTGMGSIAAVYDPVNKDLYVSNAYSNNVSVIDGLTMTRVATIAVGRSPGGAAVDTKNGYVYVPDSGSNAVTVINGTTNTVVTTLSLAPGTNSSWITFDPANGYLYISNSNTSSLTVLNGATNAVVTTFTPVPGYRPEGLTYDPANGEVYVALQNISGTTGRQNLTAAVNATTYATAARIEVGENPLGVQYDPVDGDVYVANSATGNVSIVDGTINRAIGTLTVGLSPAQVAVDPTTGKVYVTNTWSGSVSAITSAARGCVTYPVNFNETGLPAGTTWSISLNGSILSGTGTTLTTPGPNGSYAYSVAAVPGYAAHPSSGSLTVAGSSILVNITFTPTTNYSVTFWESGLPVGTAWSIILNKTLSSSTTSSIAFSDPDGTFSFTVTPVIGYYANPTHGNVTVSGSAVTMTITFTTIPVPQYNVTFSESGLPAGTSWSARLGTSTLSSSGTIIVFSETNGTYAFSITTVAGYSASPSSGSVTVNGGSVSQAFTFTPLPTYALKFAESGLAAGVSWSVSINGGVPVSSSTTTLIVSETNGTYAFTVGGATGYVVTPASGNVTVAGAPVTTDLSFTPATMYSVTFAESGLPAGTSWSVSVSSSGILHSTSTSTVTVNETNGTYTFTMSAVGYVGYPSPVTLTVAGAPLQQAVTFVQGTTRAYPVNFTESGLPPGTSWSMQLKGTSARSTTRTLSFYEPNGTYPYVVGNVPGYLSAPPAGNVTVTGKAVARTITFSQKLFSGYLTTFVETGLPAGTSWSVTIGTLSNNSTATTITFQIPNGSYSYSIGSVGGYEASPASGPLTVDGAPVQENIGFSSSGQTPPSSSLIPGLTATESYVVLGIVTAAVVGIVAAVLVHRKRRRGGGGQAYPAQPQEPPPSGGYDQYGNPGYYPEGQWPQQPPPQY